MPLCFFRISCLSSELKLQNASWTIDFAARGDDKVLNLSEVKPIQESFTDMRVHIPNKNRFTLHNNSDNILLRLLTISQLLEFKVKLKTILITIA